MNAETLQTTVVKSLWANTAMITKEIDNSLGMIHGIGLTEYMVLIHLSESPKKHLRRIDIADAVGRTASGITRMLLPMEKIGLIEKEINPRDARVSLVKISSIGETKLTEATVTLNERSDQILSNIGNKELEKFFSLLKQFN